MLQYHLRVNYIDLSLLRPPTRIYHFIFVVLVFLRYKLPKLFHPWEIKRLWLSVITVVWEITFQTTAWRVVHNFINLPFIIYFLNTTPNITQLQKWHRLIVNPNLLLINIVISMNHVLEDQISSALVQAQQHSNNIYFIYSLLSMQIIILEINIHWDQLQVQPVSLIKMMIPSRLLFHLNHSHPRSLYYPTYITIRFLSFNLPWKKILFQYSLTITRRSLQMILGW